MKNIKSGLLKTEAWTRKLCWYVCFLSIAMVAFMMLLMTVDALSGLFLNKRILGTYEIVQCMLSILVFSSWAYTQTEKGHIHVSLFLNMFPQKLRFVCFSLTSAASTVICGFLCYAAYAAMLGKMDNMEKTGTVLIPFWPFYLFECIAIAVLTIALVQDLLKSLFAITDKEFAEDIQKTWT